jgi:hypothetical protein
MGSICYLCYQEWKNVYNLMRLVKMQFNLREGDKLDWELQASDNRML